MGNLKMIAPLILILFIIGILVNSAFAGKLDDVEEESTERERDDEGEGSDHHDDAGCFMGNCLGEVFTEMSKETFYRLHPSMSEEPDKVVPRSLGESLIPYFRVNFGYQYVDEEIYAYQGIIEGGYGPAALNVRFHHYIEDVSEEGGEDEDELTITHMHLLLRLSADEKIEADVGIGGIFIDGDDHNSGFSFTLPLTIKPWSFLAIQLRPSWSSVNENKIHDYYVGISLGWRFVSAQIGYNWFGSSDEWIYGPLASASFYL